MNRFKDIIQEQMPDLKGLDGEQIEKLMIAQSAMYALLDAIKPELKLMLKEQAKIVRHDTIAKVDTCFANQEVIKGNLQSNITSGIQNLQHRWVDLKG